MIATFASFDKVDPIKVCDCYEHDDRSDVNEGKVALCVNRLSHHLIRLNFLTPRAA